MNALSLHEMHAALNASFGEANGMEIVNHYGDHLKEHAALRQNVGVLDLSFRSRLCLLGGDRRKFLHGQVTNDVNALQVWEGTYAAIITAKGKMQSDVNIYVFENELLLDFEPGLAKAITERLDKYIIADDVQIVDVAAHYGLISVQGPQAPEVIRRLQLDFVIKTKPLAVSAVKDETLGELYLMTHARSGPTGYDLFVPINAMGPVFVKLAAAAKELGGCPCGQEGLEIARIEAGIPRFGADMDETNLPPEAGLDARAVSYSKGCYIGQEVIARIRTYGQVAKALRGLRLANDLKSLPKKGDKLTLNGKDVGYVTSATFSPTHANIALAYVRREANAIGNELILRTTSGDSTAKVVPLPFS